MTSLIDGRWGSAMIEENGVWRKVCGVYVEPLFWEWMQASEALLRVGDRVLIHPNGQNFEILRITPGLAFAEHSMVFLESDDDIASWIAMFVKNPLDFDPECALAYYAMDYFGVPA